MSYLSVTKFDNYQHYKSRRPTWVKFYVALLDTKHPLNALPIATRYLFDRLLLLAANYDNAIPNDFELIARLLCMDPEECREGLDALLKGRWIKATRTTRRASKTSRGTSSAFRSPEAEVEAELEKSVSSSTSEVDGSETAFLNGHRERLSDERWYLVDKILTATRGADAETRNVLEAYAKKVSIAVLADVADRARGHKVGWAVSALKGETDA